MVIAHLFKRDIFRAPMRHILKNLDPDYNRLRGERGVEKGDWQVLFRLQGETAQAAGPGMSKFNAAAVSL